jgi:hypothetical protein
VNVANRSRRSGFGPVVGLALAIGLTACATPAPTPVLLDGWIFPAPAPLPNGARSLPLLTDPIPAAIPPDTAFGCDSALLGRVDTIYDRDDEAAPLRFVHADTQEPVTVIWQPCVSARLVDGRVEVVGPDGTVLARDGEPSLELGGGGGAEGDGTFHVCFVEYLPRLAPVTPEPAAT